jgi:hypothetical protein
MNREQARTILQATPPDGARDEALIAQALAAVRGDPELAAWWEKEQALDAAFRRKLREVPVPDALADRIIHHRRRAGFRSPAAYLPLAAVLVALGIVAAIFFGRSLREPKTEFAAFRNEMVLFLREFPRLDVETANLAEVRAWLRQKPWLASTDIPASLGRFPAIGCREITWRDRKAALVCFMVDGVVIHLFVLPASTFAEGVPPAGRAFSRGRMATVVWREGETIYLAATKGTEEFLRRHTP